MHSSFNQTNPFPVPNNNNDIHVYYHVSSGTDVNTINNINGMLGGLNQSLLGMGAWGMGMPLLGMGMGMGMGMPPMPLMPIMLPMGPAPMNLNSNIHVAGITTPNLLGAPVPVQPLCLGAPSEAGDKPITGQNNQGKCKKCGNNRATVVLIPCKHLCVCKACTRGLLTCPRCNHDVVDAVEVYQ